MKVIDSFRIVWRNLWRMKLRTALTSVGVMIGTAAIVAMMALSLGLKESAVKSLENFGNLTEMDVEPMYYNQEKDEPIPDDQRKRLNMEAVQELKKIPGIASVMPVKRLNEQAKLKVGRREGYVELVGVDVNESAAYRKNDVEKGNYLTGSPQEVVVAYDVPREMRDVEKEKREARRRNSGGGRQSDMPPDMMGGGGEGAAFNIVDKAATLVLTREYRIDDEPKFEKKELRVRVVGQLRKSENFRYSSAVYVPLSVVKELNDWVNRSRGNESDEGSPRRTREQAKKDTFEFDQMTVKVESREQVESVVKALKEKGYEVWSPARELETINKFFFVIQMVLGGIAAISLLVATIGIVNTMIMSILERTKEIGIMKVIGATVFNIRWLFLMESGFIGLIGGLAGLGMAWGAVELVNYFGASGGIMDSLNMGYGGGGPEGEPSKLAVIPAWLALFAIGFSFVIGLLAGIFPAIRASRLSALQAIRSE
ncbi:MULTISPECIES: ABC transporter permease [Brevibacillus]|uniref:ABC transporter permease n=1 Tax=Brevibacillus parabrevis TaxID=54914 RepID=A0A4Y3PF42_BREPA|nr:MULTISPECIES: ABC transporter permease [Brevibacillus]NRQ54622.1 ABC transporter permease [Brevibacillus sp. HD1.4A]MBU8711744.1 ABC transporter permease [Brevibacillus parabrevis]MDH6349627.1 acetoin utilization transport system permease protein [Brevibacillus sp. 1238]MDR4999082.1 ABC transporter permease [Brevibacillus parabrevis]MED1725797.1 ABC transporter permease [Brevibacillus parabrevis]